MVWNDEKEDFEQKSAIDYLIEENVKEQLGKLSVGEERTRLKGTKGVTLEPKQLFLRPINGTQVEYLSFAIKYNRLINFRV